MPVENNIIPTPPPDATLVGIDLVLHKRQGNLVCGYIQGNANSPFQCQNNLICSTNQNYVGCCPAGASCLISTDCLDNSAFSRGACSNIGSLTACCSDVQQAFCNVFTYVDLPYQSIVGCASIQGAAVLYANPITTGPSSTGPSTISPIQTSDPSPSSVPAGAIIGGVIGGVALLAVIGGLVTWWMMRKREKKRNFALAATAMFPATTGGRGQSPIRSPGPISETAHSPFGYDPRHSMLKPTPWDHGAHGAQPVTPGIPSPPQYSRYSPYGEEGGSNSAEAPGVFGGRPTGEAAPVEIGGTERPRERHEVYEM
ncbi:hypothetical protein QBC43DRAFT_304556 [Cladorrhinum sp. PSN259]|nr:hypothetical protein QBC43DRAFT_304556 [Cladorrhinum sp. PSN259]